MRESIADNGIGELSAAVAGDTRRRGISFGSGAQETAFRIDPIPRLIDAPEWRALSDGVAQRVRALELFIRDIYSDQRIIRAGVVPGRVLAGARHYEPQLIGLAPHVRSWITVAGLDIVRDGDGAFKVLEDNLRTPSGIAYAVATSEVLCAHLPPPSGVRLRSLDDVFLMHGEALRAAAPATAPKDPTVVLLSDGGLDSARREPTFALHMHVAVPDPESAVLAFNRRRSHIPLLALSANSPFWQGRETGLASARTPLFQAFPRVGIPRAFHDYSDYVSTIDLLLRCEAFPEPTFLWWDVRLQPRFGTIEVRIMDAQTTVSDSAALTALVQCLVRLEASEGSSADPAIDLPGACREPLPRRPRRDRGEPHRRPNGTPLAGAGRARHDYSRVQRAR